MPTIPSMTLPKTNSPEEFEYMCKDVLDVLNEKEGLEFEKYGKPGQPQNGIDLIATNEKGRIIVAQCKNYLQPETSTRLIASIKKDIDAIKKWSDVSKIDKIYIMTSYDTDIKIQDKIRNLISVYREFNIKVFYWFNIKNIILKNKNILKNYYPDYIPSETKNKTEHEFISTLKEMSSDYEHIEKINFYDYYKRRELFKNESFVQYFVRFLGVDTPEAVRHTAINLIPYDPYVNENIRNIIVSGAKIITMFKSICKHADIQENNKLLIHTITLLRNIGEFGSEYSRLVFNLLKSNTIGTELQEICFIYCRRIGGTYRAKNEITREIVDYILLELKNKNPLNPRDEWIYLLLSHCADENDIKIIYEVFINNDKETQEYIVKGMGYIDEYTSINNTAIRKLFLAICEKVYAWNDDHYTSELLLYCLFNRTHDVFTDNEIYEKLNSFNDDVFEMFFRGISKNEEYILNDKGKKDVRKIIKAREHPRKKIMLDWFK